MIAKKVRRAHAKRGKAAMIAALFDYVTATEDKAGTTKCAYTLGANFLCGSLHAWRAEMIALAQESVHSPMPVSHWVLSWQEAEIPSEEQCREALQIFLEGMGLSGHQAVLALHRNTGNVHAHILVNRVNPVTEKTVQPHKGFDIEAGHRIVARIEHAQGWQPQANARYRVNGQGEVERVARQTAPTPTARAQAYEQATGAKSAMRIAQERAPSCIDAAQTWQELHHALAHVGLRFVRKGSGAVLLVGVEAGFDFRPGSIVVADRGYCNYTWFKELTNKGILFVTRLKRNASYRLLERCSIKRKSGVTSDHRIEVSCKGHPLRLRRIGYHDPNTGKHYKFLTNNFSLSAKTIADIYKERWQIELFFKEIKQNLHIKRFIGNSLNAVLTQIYSALTVYLLLAFQKLLSKTGTSVQHLFELINVNLFGTTSLADLLNSRRRIEKSNYENSLLPLALPGQ